MTVKHLFEDLVVRFNQKAENDAALQKELEGITRKVQIDLGSEQYRFILENKRITSFDEGRIENPDISLISDPLTIEELVSGRMKPMKAFALKKVRVKGSLDDLLRLRKFF
ncbi:MAG: SCP2 sterol-binding domain-containing protein [Methanomassiliicoccales archaeon]|nr:SCP2 sterol-binding domain-containing protein [Methanomassiliicoccales archaeon]